MRRYKLVSGLAQEERIDDQDRIDRYMRFFSREQLVKLEAGQKVFLEKDEWQIIPD